jgi:hypothetical protein
VLLKWLVVSSVPHCLPLPADGPGRTLYAEGDMVALMGVLSQTLRKPAVSERRTVLPRRRNLVE